ncbi:hypothetical protein FQR65_LT20010 [Abscondita terminalis]|nr:hypothetical protein FQR65_LT20010 [Abscondita terminalis]
MDQFKNEIRVCERVPNKNIVCRRRISSDTSLPRTSNQRVVVQLKQPNRQPLRDLDVNVSAAAVNSKPSTSSNEEHSCNDNKNKLPVVSGYISKVTQKRLKLKNSATPPHNVLEKPTVKKTAHSKNSVISIIPKSSIPAAKGNCQLFHGFSNSTKRTGTLVFEAVPKHMKIPARKVSLLKKFHPRLRTKNTEAYQLDIYTLEYLENIISYQLTIDSKYVAKKNSLKKYNDFRAALIEALIKVIKHLDQPNSILFTTVRLFDHILNSTTVPLHMFQILSYITMWIVIKMDNNYDFPSVSKLVNLCSNAYTASEILEMERWVLKFLDYTVNISDTTVYTNFYIMKLPKTNDLLPDAVQYILECYTLNSNFSTFKSSMQAAGAVCLGLQLLQSESTLWSTLTNTVGYYTHRELEDVMQDMLKQIYKIQDPHYEYRFPYQKYSEKDKQQVSVVLFDKLKAF